MSWIKTVPYEQADADLRRIYESVRAVFPSEYNGDPVASLVRPDGSKESIVSAHSLIPEALRHMMSGLGVLLQPNLPLTRRQHEMIAAVVSVHNRCFY
jgi:hypothetical protein